MLGTFCAWDSQLMGVKKGLVEREIETDGQTDGRRTGDGQTTDGQTDGQEE